MTITAPSAIDAAAINKGLRAAFESGRTRDLGWRKAQLQGLLRMLAEGDAELTAALVEDLRRPTMEAFSADLGPSRSEVGYILKHVERWMRPTKVRLPLMAMPGRGEIHHEPLGVALIIAPWNYPIYLMVAPMAAALAAGNCVLAKPSELAPASSAALARLLPRYLDPEAVVVVEGGVDETTALLEQRWDHIFFTGSTAVGRVVAAAAAKHLTPTVLELGGKSPTYVHASADLDVTARRIAFGKLLNTGQTCIAPDYLLVDRGVRDALVEKLASQIALWHGTDPQQSDSLSRIINQRHLGRLQRLLDSAGGTVVAGGTVDAADRYVAPTIIVDPAADSPLMQEEIFGPILPVLTVDGPDDAVERITRAEKPLALYVFAQDGAVADDVIDRTSSGGVCVNHTLFHIVPPTLPFGGVGESGMGAYHGKAGFDVFSHHKSVLRKPVKPDLKALYPPYKATMERIIRLVFR